MEQYGRLLTLVPFGAGVCLHLFYFRLGEHHMLGTFYLQFFISIFVLSISATTFRLQVPAFEAFQLITKIALHTLLGLFSSQLLYRLTWHPLRRFHGPILARISGLWLTSHVAKSATTHKKATELYNTYGPFVRVGPSDLMIVHPLAVPAVHGLHSKCRKGTWYDEDWPRRSIHTCRDPHFHRQRRRLWSQAFSDKALRGYETRVAFYNSELLRRVSESNNSSLNASKWFHYYSFDVMGDLAFDRDFSMLKSGNEHWAVSLLEEALSIQGMKLPTWIFRMIVAIPGMTRTYWKFINYCDEQLAAKMKDKKSEQSQTTNLMSVLLEAAGPQPTHQDLLNLQSDSRTIIVAGSDTTAAALSHIFYLLAKYPEHVLRLRQELLPLRVNDEPFEHQKILHAEHLNAVINEALRLYPVPPTTIMRKTPPEGIAVDGVFIPGETNVWTPAYVLGRSEMAYESPYDFVPERWYSKTAMIKDMSGYAPFSTGPYGCIGKPLALLQLRTLTAEIISRFDISFAPGNDGSEFIDSVKDTFTWGMADLNLCFKPCDVVEGS